VAKFQCVGMVVISHMILAEKLTANGILVIFATKFISFFPTPILKECGAYSLNICVFLPPVMCVKLGHSPGGTKIY
jgi:hypothetical protein